MIPVRAVGFDLGETLVTYADAPLNWASLYRPALKRVASVLEIQPTEEQFVAAETAVAVYNTRLNPRTREIAAETIFADVLATWSRTDTTSREQAIVAFFVFFQQSLRVYDDTVKSLKALRTRGVRVGVLTDVPYGMPREFVQRDLEQTQLASLVDVVLTSVEVGFRKPAPDGFLRLSEALGCARDEMLYVGNEPKDIDGAKSADLSSVLIDREGVCPLLGQSFTIRSLHELDGLIAASGSADARDRTPQ